MATLLPWIMTQRDETIQSEIERIIQYAQDEPGPIPVRAESLLHLGTPRWVVNLTSSRQTRAIGVMRIRQGVSTRPTLDRFGLRAPSSEKAADRPCHDSRGRPSDRLEAANP